MSSPRCIFIRDLKHDCGHQNEAWPLMLRAALLLLAPLRNWVALLGIAPKAGEEAAGVVFGSGDGMVFDRWFSPRSCRVLSSETFVSGRIVQIRSFDM